MYAIPYNGPIVVSFSWHFSLVLPFGSVLVFRQIFGAFLTQQVNLPCPYESSISWNSLTSKAGRTRVQDILWDAIKTSNGSGLTALPARPCVLRAQKGIVLRTGKSTRETPVGNEERKAGGNFPTAVREVAERSGVSQLLKKDPYCLLKNCWRHSMSSDALLQISWFLCYLIRVPFAIFVRIRIHGMEKVKCKRVVQNESGFYKSSIASWNSSWQCREWYNQWKIKPVTVWASNVSSTWN